MDKFITRKEKRKSGETNPEIDDSDEPPNKVITIKPKVAVASKPTSSSATKILNDLGDDSPAQPILNNFPKDSTGRHFRPDWYSMFPWLEYSVSQQKVFCFACRKFGTNTCKSEIAFTANGFSNWKKALENGKGLKKHNNSSDHTLSMVRWEDKKMISEGKKKSIVNLIDPERESLVKNNQEYFSMLIKYHIHFVTNEQPYRGHDETDDSKNPGKWKSFINLQLETNAHFKELYDNILAQNATYDYTSKRSCNEMVESLGDVVRDMIISEINQSGMYSVLIDESKDNAGHEEMATCFRYVLENKIYERFFKLSRVPLGDAEHIVNDHLLPILQNPNLHSVLVGGGADGASVMSGCHEGVFQKLKRVYSWMIYIHCAAHRLNLVVTCYLSSNREAKSIITVYKSLHHIFSVANNREIYEDQQKNLYPKQQIKQLSGLTEVRWSCRYEGVNTVINTIKAILVSLQLIANGNSNTADQAAGTYHKIMSSSFITSMVFLHNILAITDGLNKHLQEVNVDFVVAQGELNVCKKLLADLSVEKVEKKVIDICSDIDIHTEYEDPIHATRKTLCDYFKLSKADGKTKVVDQLSKLKDTAVKKLIKELDHRFNEMKSNVIGSLHTLDASSAQYLEYSRMEPLIEHYRDQISVDETLLEAECSRAKLSLETGNSIVPELYPNLIKIIQLYKSLPVNTATVERGFSCMNRIISYVRNSLTSERASDLMLLSINKDLLTDINTDHVIKKWAGKRKYRHIPLS